MVIRPIHEKQPYEIRFQANDGKPQDLYVVLTGWLEVPGGDPPPPDTDNEVRPGESCVIPGVAPSMDDARRLRIEVSIPHPTGGGTLTVVQGTSQSYPVADDTTFLSALIS